MQAINQTCPWSGEPVRSDSLTTYRGQTVGFCDPGCRDKFAAAVALFDAATQAGPTLTALSGARSTPARLSEAALVVIDAQGQYVEGPLRLEGIDRALARLAELLARARAAGTPVIHVVHVGKPGGAFDPDGPGGAILPQAAPLPDEPIVRKRLPNSFAGTDLLDRLRATGRGSVLIAGFMTHNCVSSTARAALDHGFFVTVVGDAATTRALPDPLGGPAIPAQEVHRAALAELADRTAVVATLAGIGG